MKRSCIVALSAVAAFVSNGVRPAEGAGDPASTKWMPKPRPKAPEPPGVAIQWCHEVGPRGLVTFPGMPECLSVAIVQAPTHEPTVLNPSGEWIDVLKVSVVTEAGEPTGIVFKPTRLPNKPFAVPDSTLEAAGEFEVGPGATATLAPGRYQVVATLSIPATDVSAGWTGTKSKAQVLTVDPKPMPESEEYRSTRHLRVLRWHIDHGDSAAAMSEANAWVADVPQSLGAFVVRGDLYFAQQKWNLALADYDVALSRMPDGGELDPPFMQRRTEAFFKVNGLTP